MYTLCILYGNALSSASTPFAPCWPLACVWDRSPGGGLSSAAARKSSNENGTLHWFKRGRLHTGWAGLGPNLLKHRKVHDKSCAVLSFHTFCTLLAVWDRSPGGGLSSAAARKSSNENGTLHWFKRGRLHTAIKEGRHPRYEHVQFWQSRATASAGHKKQQRIGSYHGSAQTALSTNSQQLTPEGSSPRW